MANKGRLTTGIFCLFLAGLLAWHIALPNRARSETENRTLAQFPDFSWETLKNGSFTDSDIEAAVLAVTNGLTAIGDTPSSYTGWYFECFCNDELITPQQQAERYRAVTRDRIIEAAKSLSLDSIYLMLNKEAE